VDKTNHLYFVVIDGRYSESEGMKIPEMAHLMQSLKCKEALNLDGGGSTCLVANNQVINRPSDPAGPRKVVSVVLIRDRRKKKFELSSA
jgi:exopolysaccharide biosynthesis protein